MTIKGKIMTTSCGKTGYPVVTLRAHPAKRKNMKIHRLVALAFLYKPSGKDVVNHLDGNKTNNLYSNLEWCTQKENIQHAFKTGAMNQCIGSNHRIAKLTEKDVINIRKMLKSCVPQKVIASKYGVSLTTISTINTRRVWKHV